ncbi:MAG: hypothetical protein ACNA8P_09530 [Phycisphaerales bacterium]
MKISRVLAATGAGLAITAAASADNFDPALDIVLDLGSFTLISPANGGAPVDFDVIGPADVVGFSFAGDVSGISGTSSWASDMQLNISIDGTQVYSIGGFSGVQNNWDFQGSGSTNDGFYQSGPHLIAKDNPVAEGAAWTFSFVNDWNSTLAADMDWSGVTLTIHRIPTPGAVGLVGLAGLAAIRRRR